MSLPVFMPMIDSTCFGVVSMGTSFPAKASSIASLCFCEAIINPQIEMLA
jgi:hypothetical protein